MAIADLAPDATVPEAPVEPEAPVAAGGPGPAEVVEVGDLAPDVPSPPLGETAEPVAEPPAGEEVGESAAADLEAAVEEEAFGGFVEETEVAEEAEPAVEAEAEGVVEPEPEPTDAPAEPETPAAEGTGDGGEGGDFGDWDLDALDAYSAAAVEEEEAGEASEPVPKWGEWEEEEEAPEEEASPEPEGSLGETQAWEGPIPGAEEEAPEAGEPGDEFGEELVQGADFGNADAGAAWEEAGGQEEAGAGTGTVAEPEAPPRERDPRERDAGGTPAARRERAAAPSRARRRRRRRRERKPSPLARVPRTLAVLALVALGTVTLHWFDLVRVPGMDRALVAILGPVRAGRAPIVDTSGSQPETPVLGYSLSVDTYRDAATVRDVATALGDRLPGLNFVVSPVEIDGELVYRLLAGPATTAEEAEALRTPLSRVLSREDPSRWTARITYLAFVVDESGSLEAARGRRDEIREAGIPAYVLEVVYP
ncbi:MAG TPA: hypothetical protein VLL48_02200, partial [Longimicrobiales bacterium]|nr:hypothetical protein [Longimicrobiales bacterium]